MPDPSTDTSTPSPVLPPNMRGAATKLDEGSALLGKEQAEAAKIRSDVDQAHQDISGIFKSLSDQKLDAKPPTYDQKEFRAPQQEDPMHAFGSMAGVLASIASLATKAPLATSLKAAAAGMNAIKQGNADAYNKAYDLWKTNSDYAYKHAQWENDQYKNAIDLFKTDIQMGLDKAKTIAQITGDEVSSSMLESNNLKDFVSLQESRQRMAESGQKAAEDLAEYNTFVKPIMNAAPGSTERAAAEHNFAEFQAAKKGGPALAKPGTLGEFLEQKRAELAPGQIWTSADTEKATAEYNQKTKASSSRSPATAAMSKWMQDHPDATDEQYEEQAARIGEKITAARAFGTGKQGQAINSFNVGISHLNTLQGLADALHNGDIKTFNSIAQKTSELTGHPAPTNFDTAKAIVGDEIVKAVTGSAGALGDRETAQGRLDRVNSPAQLSGVIKTYKDLMEGQLNGLRLQYKQTTGFDDFDDRLAPETKDELESSKAGGSDHSKLSDDELKKVLGIP